MALCSSPSLDVATPERVALTLPVAGIGYRCLAWLVDATILFFFWVTAYFVFSLLVSDVLGVFQALSGLAQTLLAVGFFATQWMYWTLAEVFFRGQTPGKRLLRIRVVRVDGSPVGVYESAVRNLCAPVDFLPVLYAVGCLSMLLHRAAPPAGGPARRHLLVREERFDLDKYTAPAQAPEAVPARRCPPAAAAGAEDVELILAFLERAAWLEPDARRRLGTALVERLGGLTDEERAAVLASLAGHRGTSSGPAPRRCADMAAPLPAFVGRRRPDWERLQGLLTRQRAGTPAPGGAAHAGHALPPRRLGPGARADVLPGHGRAPLPQPAVRPGLRRHLPAARASAGSPCATSSAATSRHPARRGRASWP